MSVSKPFVFALVCDALGPDELRTDVGVNATGLPFNSLEAIERSDDGRTNPMVNPGAIATTSLVPGPDPRRAGPSAEGLSRFAGGPRARRGDLRLGLGDELPEPRAPRALDERGRLGCDPGGAVDLYTRQCCLAVTARDLAVMGATLADGGVNPLTHGRSSVRSLSPCARRDGDRRALRDLGRLAVRRRAARQERDRRGHRDRRAREGRARHVRAAARRGGEQRQGPARRPASSPALGLDLFASEPAADRRAWENRAS